MQRVRNQNNNSMKHEGGDRDTLIRTWRQINGSMNNTAKDLDHTELTKSIDRDGGDDDDGDDIKNEQEWMRENEGDSTAAFPL